MTIYGFAITMTDYGGIAITVTRLRSITVTDYDDSAGLHPLNETR